MCIFHYDDEIMLDLKAFTFIQLHSPTDLHILCLIHYVVDCFLFLLQE